MSKNILTLHAKNRYVERVGPRSNIKDNVDLVLIFGLRGSDISKEYELIKRFLGKNKIYYNGYIFIFASQKNKPYHILLTVYEYPNDILKKLQEQKIYNIKINNIKLSKMNLKQLIVSFGSENYNVIFNFNRVAMFHKIEEKDKHYIFPKYIGNDMYNRIQCFLSQFKKGKAKRFDFEVDYSFFTPEEKVVFRAISLIPYGETITYKKLLNTIHLELTMAQLGRIIKECQIDYFIPTHRVVRSNGGLGNHHEGSEFKKKLLQIEKDTLEKEKKLREIEERTQMKFEEKFCYNICNLNSDKD